MTSTETTRRVRVSSTALGQRAVVNVYIYDTLEAMRNAANDYNGSDNSNALAVTQAFVEADTGRARVVTIRLARDHLGTRIVVHEMHHATSALYGAHVGNRVSRSAHFNHWNEPFAHLHSDLTYRLVDRLYKLGYYIAQDAERS